MDGSCQYDSCRRRSKRGKHKSKVWNKVTWFSRKGRQSKDCHSNLSPEGPLSDDSESMSTWSTTASPRNSRSYIDSGSSSDNDTYENNDGYYVKRSKRFPNSEVIEQNCLRPSVAKALFMQLDSIRIDNAHSSQYAWHRKGKAPVDPDDVLLPRSLSEPEEIVAKICHCIACCSCSLSDRLNGVCPVYRRKCVSTTSLDRGLVGFENATAPCDVNNDLFNEDTKQASTLPKTGKSLANNSCKDIATSHLTKSLETQSQNVCHLCRPQTNLPISTKATHDRIYKHCNHDDVPDKAESVNNCNILILNQDTGDSVNSENTAGSFTESFSTPQTINHDTYQRKLSITNENTSPAFFKHRADSIEEWFCGFTNEQKNAVLHRLLVHCSVPQTHLICEQLCTYPHPGCPPNCQDRIRWLPQSLVLTIFSFLDPVSLCRASSVCKVWYELANEASLWRKFCSQPKWKLSRTGEQKQIIQHISPSTSGAVHWKRVFSERFRLHDNWMKGRCTVRTFEGHTQGVSCVQFDDTRIVSGSSDKTIKVWNIRTNSPWSVQTLVGHSGTVRCLHLDGNRLVSGSTDRTIKVWDLSTQHTWSSIACKVTMTGHYDTVRCLQVDADKVISGSYDQTLKVWDIRTGHCRKTLRGHEAAVLCVRFDNSKIVSGSCDKTIKVWNFEGDCIRTLQGHQDAVTCLQFDTQRIVSGSLDCNLKFWNINTGECRNTIDWKASEGHTGVVRCLQADSWRVVSASDDRTLKVWSLETGKRLVTLRNHEDGVTCLQFNDSIIVSGSYDKTVKLWDFSSV